MRRSVHAPAPALLLALVLVGCSSGPAASVGSAESPRATTGSVGSTRSTATIVPAATPPASTPTAPASAPSRVILAGKIVTMADPPLAEALYIEGGVVAALGARDDALRVAGDGVPVVELGEAVAYPGFIDAHAHWIGDRGYYAVATAAEAMEAAVVRSWTSISEQWVNLERLEELERLSADGALPLRVDAYLALNYDKEFFGDWYESVEPRAVGDHLRVRGLKVHLDDGWGTTITWEPQDPTTTIRRANDAGWQISVHAMSSAAMEMALDAYATALGPTGPNPLHRRIEHAMQVTDEQLDRLVDMDIAIVTHLDGASDWLLDDRVVATFDRGAPGEQLSLLDRWRDFVDAGLHVAAATDAPWTFPDVELAEVMGRPVDQIASGMDGKVRTSPTTPAWAGGQLLTAEQGVRAVTLDAAWALGDEARRGHLSPGAVGDVTILSGDILNATPDEIRAMTVVATIVGGVPACCGDAVTCARLHPRP